MSTESTVFPEVFNRAGAIPGSYAIYVNSYVVASGAYQLCANQPSTPPTATPTPTRTPTPSCRLPQAAINPNPPDGQTGVGLQTSASWNASANKVIYGADNRLDIYQVQDSNALAAADSTVMLVRPSKLTLNGDGTYTIDSTTFLQDSGGTLCPDEPFLNQPSPGHCSGFLVGSDLVATAGHCVTTAGDCSGTAVVFGFDMLNAVDARIVVPAEDVYFCSELVRRRQVGEEDWALFRLNREVVGHAPLPIRRQGKIADGQSVTVIGHPVGLPKKVSGGANVRTDINSLFFVANLDTYGGNSGSPVFNTNTWTVEGVLVRGEDDFVSIGGCTRSRQCADNACGGEGSHPNHFVFLVCTRDSLHRNLRCLLWRVRESGFPGNDQRNGVDAAHPEGGDEVLLAGGRQECLRVVESPVWSFTTVGVLPTPNAIPTAINPQADINQDLLIDEGDLLILLRKLEDQGQPLIPIPDGQYPPVEEPLYPEE